jgi:transcriptional regulator EpsA
MKKGAVRLAYVHAAQRPTAAIDIHHAHGLPAIPSLQEESGTPPAARSASTTTAGKTKNMPLHVKPSGADFDHYVKLIESATTIRRHVELLQWLQGGVQQYLPHDILLAGWGNFQEKSLQHDMLSRLPGVRSYGVGTDGLPFLLSKFYDCWMAAGRKPCHFSFQRFEYLLGHSSLPGSFSSALRGMRSVLIHGLRDERSQHECLYILLSAADIAPEPSSSALCVLMPCLDSVLRQITPLPQQRRQCLKPRPGGVQDEALGLSERENQIMDWVAMGKTNSEIGSILNISAYTVKNHMQRIFQKLNVFNRAQAVSKVNRISFNG